MISNEMFAKLNSEGWMTEQLSERDGSVTLFLYADEEFGGTFIVVRSGAVITETEDIDEAIESYKAEGGNLL